MTGEPVISRKLTVGAIKIVFRQQVAQGFLGLGRSSRQRGDGATDAVDSILCAGEAQNIAS